MTELPWDKPNGICSHCSAPLNEYYVGGYKLHDGTYAVRHVSENIIVPHRYNKHMQFCFSENEI